MKIKTILFASLVAVFMIHSDLIHAEVGEYPDSSAPAVSLSYAGVRESLAKAQLDQSYFASSYEKVHFQPQLEVNTNRGTFKTSFALELPENRAGVSKLQFHYNSHNSMNQGYGVGWTLDLPQITQMHHRILGKSYAVKRGESDNFFQKIALRGIFNEKVSHSFDQAMVEGEHYQVYRQLIDQNF